MLVLTLICLILFGPPLISALIEMRRRSSGGGFRLPVRPPALLGGFRGGQPAAGAFRVVDRGGRVQVAAVTQAVCRAVTGSLQPTRYTHEVIARSEGWAILAHPETYGPLEQYRAVIEQDIVAGLREFVAEHRHNAFTFSLDHIIQDADVFPGEIRVVTTLEAKARVASMKQAEHAAREAREARQRAAAETQPRLTLVAGDGPGLVVLHEGENGLGRHPDKGDAQVLVATVSRVHAAIEIDALGNAYIEDHGSTHGTFVNDEQLAPYEPVPLAHDAVIRLGKDVVYRYEAGSIGLLPTTR